MGALLLLQKGRFANPRNNPLFPIFFFRKTSEMSKGALLQVRRTDANRARRTKKGNSEEYWCEQQGSNLWPLPCEGSALPLSYARKLNWGSPEPGLPHEKYFYMVRKDAVSASWLGAVSTVVSTTFATKLRYFASPVPAGTKRPMITFSFRPFR